MKNDFYVRLVSCARAGDLTRQDLACWFGRPYTTIRDWLLNKRMQDKSQPQGREAYRRLQLLEKAIVRDDRFPIPQELGQRERRRYVNRLVGKYIRQRHSSGLSASRPAA